MKQSYRATKNSPEDEFWIFPSRGKTGFYFHSFLPDDSFSYAYSYRGKILMSVILSGYGSWPIVESAFPFSAVVDSLVTFYLTKGSRRFGLRLEAGKKTQLYEILEKEGRLLAEGAIMPASFSTSVGLSSFTLDDYDLKFLSSSDYPRGRADMPVYSFQGNPFFYPPKAQEGLGVWQEEGKDLEGGYFAENRVLLYGLRIHDNKKASFVNSAEGYEFSFSAEEMHFTAPGVDCIWKEEGSVFFNGAFLGQID